MFTQVMQYILDLGPAVMLPTVIIIFSLCLGMKFGESFKAGLQIGIGFVGIGLVIGLMLDSLGPAAKGMAQNFDINLHVIDLGWPGASPITWASQIALIAIPIAIVVNIAMLLLKATRVVNVDIWNIWHMTFTGALVHIATGSYWLGILGVVVHAAFVYKLGDWFSYDTKHFFELDGIAIPHGTSAYLGPIAVLVDSIIEKIPGLNKINFSADDLQKRFGPLGEPVTVGFIMGLIIGLLANYAVKETLQLAIKTAAVMLLMPRVIKPIMDGLTPIARHARKKLQAKFGGEAFLIGLDPALLLGHTSVVSASLIFIPLTIFIAVILPGNQVLPFGDLATIGFFVAMAVAIHQGNLFRTLISGTIIMSITLWIATQTIALNTQLAANAGALKAGEQVASMDQGGSPVTYLLIQLLTFENIIGLAVIGTIYTLGVLLTWRRAKAFQLAEKLANKQ
ncbi:PTS system galactitol-specific EIIC component, Gat family [Pasteurella multocida]|uniref:PTS galactitol transporter subunit IIC n=1 Tax=Pasteurella multocida TaxID=747 RepID=UPI000282854F|nr:galactitol-specific PTS transporter subunit IIC [Pasteurella multocida]ARB74554.1 PTS galactitol transporter subunit IIC [Pasteurella multocida]EJZ79560.1 PTS system, galactitol-specific IIC component [Pasteurella multocida subsp. gallicida X73]MCL7791370.1 galactitol-specific PTS transporter subunit IIC [Pasteurella multocida]OBP27273.1 PTS galactitol transporter subunit IIC [Pasteurella multocida subsp. multocida]URH95132.1 galactitol-specific PTS transporter subunit IIC [Pasteurella mult